MDVIHQILAHNAGREPERLQRKYDRMRESAFVFLRATCPLFWQRLPAGLALFEAGPDGAPISPAIPAPTSAWPNWASASRRSSAPAARP